MAKDSSELLGRVSNLGQEDSSRDIYDDWSQDCDEHLKTELGYLGFIALMNAFLPMKLDVKRSITRLAGNRMRS